jgi:hypothetical protein
MDIGEKYASIIKSILKSLKWFIWSLGAKGFLVTVVPMLEIVIEPHYIDYDCFSGLFSHSNLFGYGGLDELCLFEIN